jgi:hypothetical protein
MQCPGERPRCSTCIKKRSECLYVAATGETQHQAIKRKHADLQQSVDAYDELIRLVRTRSSHEATEIFGRIRSGNSVEAILRHVQAADLLLQLHVVPSTRYQYSFPFSKEFPQFLIQAENPILGSLLYRYSSFQEPQPSVDGVKSSPSLHPYQIPFHAAELIDPRLSTIKTKTWTSVIDDDSLLRELLQHFFLLEYIWLPAFHKDYFLEDMANEQRRFCSSLLVNAVLAAACVSSYRMF